MRTFKINSLGNFQICYALHLHDDFVTESVFLLTPSLILSNLQSPLAAIILLLVSMSSVTLGFAPVVFQTPYVNETMQYLSFLVSLTSLSIIFFKSIHIVANVKISLLWLSSTPWYACVQCTYMYVHIYVYVCMYTHIYHIFFIHSSTDGH